MLCAEQQLSINGQCLCCVDGQEGEVAVCQSSALFDMSVKVQDRASSARC